MNKKYIFNLAVLVMFGFISMSGPAFADTSKLIGSLTDMLGVSKEQATGGGPGQFSGRPKIIWTPATTPSF